MKILIVNKFLYPNGGSETYIFKIGQELMQMGHEVQYFGMEHEGRIVGNHAGVYTKPLDFHGGSRLDQLKMPFKILYSREAKTDIKRVLEDFHPDVVHFNNINFQLTPSVIEAVREYEREQQGESSSRAGGHIPIVYTAHDAQWVCPNHLLRVPSTGEICTRCIDGDYSNCAKNRCIHNSKLRSILGEKEAELYRKRGTYRLVDTIISPSQFLADTLAHNPQLKGRIVTMHNFFDEGDADASVLHRADRTNPADRDRDEKGRAGAAAGSMGTAGAAAGSIGTAGTAADSPGKTAAATGVAAGIAPGYVLYFGRYTVEKGVETLLKVAKRLPDIPFVFAGRGDLESQVNAVPNVRNVGFRNQAEIRELIRNAAFVVFPSEWLENGPFSVIESIMNGTPVVGSRLGGTPELIAEGETGELFEAGNEFELADKVRALYDDPVRLDKLREGCRRTMEGRGSIHFDTLQEYCEKLVKIYSA